MTERILETHPRVGPHIRGTFRALETVLSRTLNGLGVRYSHFQVLNILWLEDGQTQRSIARASYITDSSLAQVLNEMVSQGLVERKRSMEDGRKRLITLTPRGAALEDHIMPTMRGVMDIALDGLSHKDISRLISTNIKIRENLNTNFNLRASDVSNKKIA